LVIIQSVLSGAARKIKIMGKFQKGMANRHESDVARWWPEARQTIASGAKFEKGDVKTAEVENITFDIECKCTQNKSYSITKEVWQTIKQHAQDRAWNARPVLAVRLYGPTEVEESWGTRNNTPESLEVVEDLVVMELHDWLEFYEEFLRLKEQENKND